MAPNSGGRGDNKDPLSRYDPLSPGGIRAETRYVFPDGSVRRHVVTPGASGRAATGSGGVPLPLVGTSRVASADLSLALGIDALSVGGAYADGSDGGGSGGVGQTAEQRRRARNCGSRGNSGNGGAYRGPGAAPGAGWAPEGRPPRAYVPFLNLPASNSSANRSKGKRRRQKHRLGRDGSVSDGSASSLFPSVYSSDEKGRNAHRGRPLAGMGGVPISPGRVMLTGPGRPGTGASSSSRMPFGDTGSENHRLRRPRRRLGGGGGGGNTPMGDEELSDGGDSVGSGSTDVEFLRRRAEAKLRSLDRQEASDLATGRSFSVSGWMSCTRRGQGPLGVCTSEPPHVPISCVLTLAFFHVVGKLTPARPSSRRAGLTGFIISSKNSNGTIASGGWAQCRRTDRQTCEAHVQHGWKQQQVVHVFRSEEAPWHQPKREQYVGRLQMGNAAQKLRACGLLLEARELRKGSVFLCDLTDGRILPWVLLSF